MRGSQVYSNPVTYVNGFYISKTVIFNFYAPTMPMRFLVDTTYICTYLLCKAFFIHADILLSVSEFVVVAVLFEWWLFYLSGGWYRPLWAHHCGINVIKRSSMSDQ